MPSISTIRPLTHLFALTKCFAIAFEPGACVCSYDENATGDEFLDAFRHFVEGQESTIRNGPIVPSVTPDEIRTHLKLRYGFGTPLNLDEVVADVQRMLQTWQV